jgi:hypothetical protein
MRVIGASPFCNSFFDAGYLKGKIPKIYRRRLGWVREIFGKDQKQLGKKEVFEWEVPGWTFHAKQFNLRLGGGEGDWFLNTIGSNNFNRRSFERDIESSMFLFSKSEILRSKIAAEQANIEKSLIKLDAERAAQKFMRYGPVDYTLDYLFRSFT